MGAMVAGIVLAAGGGICLFTAALTAFSEGLGSAFGGRSDYAVPLGLTIGGLPRVDIPDPGRDSYESVAIYVEPTRPLVPGTRRHQLGTCSDLPCSAGLSCACVIDKNLAWWKLGQDCCLKFRCRTGTGNAMKFQRERRWKGTGEGRSSGTSGQNPEF